MKYIYVIATGTAKNLTSKQLLWDLLRAAGLPLRDIHDLPRVSQHEIAIADIAVANLNSKRMETAEKKVKTICLMVSDDIASERRSGFPKEYIEKIITETRQFGLQNADYCVPADELEVAARLIINIVNSLESTFYNQ